MSDNLRILMVIEALATGGAEWAFVRLANALAAGHEVTAYVPFACSSTPALMGAFDKRVSVVSLPLPHRWFHRLLYKVTLLFPALKLEQRIHSWVLGLLHRSKQFSVVNPHLRGATMMCCAAFKNESVPIVETDHGDYAFLASKDHALECNKLLFERLDGMVCPAGSNEARIKRLPWKSTLASTVIPNAVEKPSTESLKKDQPFTFGLIARGIPEKGWAEALAAFRLLRQRVGIPLRLLFVGDGDFLHQLRHEVAADEGVVFAGYQASVEAWVAQCDVGLLPSFFAAESLPNTIIECQVKGKPVIATRIGGIPEMIQDSGILVPLDATTGRADIDALAAAMQSMVADSSMRESFARAAREEARRYAPENVGNLYRAFFEHVIRSMTASKLEKRLS